MSDREDYKDTVWTFEIKVNENALKPLKEGETTTVWIYTEPVGVSGPEFNTTVMMCTIEDFTLSTIAPLQIKRYENVAEPMRKLMLPLLEKLNGATYTIQVGSDSKYHRYRITSVNNPELKSLVGTSWDYAFFFGSSGQGPCCYGVQNFVTDYLDKIPMFKRYKVYEKNANYGSGCNTKLYTIYTVDRDRLTYRKPLTFHTDFGYDVVKVPNLIEMLGDRFIYDDDPSRLYSGAWNIPLFGYECSYVDKFIAEEQCSVEEYLEADNNNNNNKVPLFIMSKMFIQMVEDLKAFKIPDIQDRLKTLECTYIHEIATCISFRKSYCHLNLMVNYT